MNNRRERTAQTTKTQKQQTHYKHDITTIENNTCTTKRYKTNTIIKQTQTNNNIISNNTILTQ